MLMWEPNEICHILCKFDKTLHFPEELCTEGLFVLLIKNGELVAESGEKAFRAGKNELVFFGGTTRLIPLAAKCEISICGFEGSAASGLSGIGAHKPNTLLCANAAALSERIFSANGDLSPAECFAFICALFDAAHSPVDEIPPLVAEAMAQIRENYSGIYGVEELSDNLGVSKSHLIRAFSASVGKTPGEYLTEVRIEAAKRLLSGHDYPIDIVAGLCGFSGANYLCRLFKKRTGYTPAQYRKMFFPSSLPPLPQEQSMYV